MYDEQENVKCFRIGIIHTKNCSTGYMALINEVSNSIIYVYVLREFSCCSVNELFNINGEEKTI